MQRMIFHLGCELREENIKMEGVSTVMKCLRKEDWGSKGKSVASQELGFEKTGEEASVNSKKTVL